MVQYFSGSRPEVLLCVFFQFGAAISLGIFTASMVSRLRFLGVTASGTNIAWFGGLAVALNMMASVSLLWVMIHPGITQDPRLLNAFYDLSFFFGGPGFSVPMGLLIAGISIPAGFMKLLPKGVVFFGLILAVIGVVSSLDILTGKALFLIPLTRFPAFVWLILAGFQMPAARKRKVPEKGVQRMQED